MNATEKKLGDYGYADEDDPRRLGYVGEEVPTPSDPSPHWDQKDRLNQTKTPITEQIQPIPAQAESETEKLSVLEGRQTSLVETPYGWSEYPEPSDLPDEINPDHTDINEVLNNLRSGAYDSLLPDQDQDGGMGKGIPTPSDKDVPPPSSINSSDQGVLSIDHTSSQNGPREYKYKASDIERDAERTNQPYGTYLKIHNINPADVDPDN